jgi:DNA-binding GntR family transcriptional regulator
MERVDSRRERREREERVLKSIATESPGGLVSGPSFREQARDFIRGLIVAGRMRPDELYSAPRLAAELQVSVTPVREALLDLVGEGLLEPVRNRGFKIVLLTPKELNDIYAIRLLLEVPSVAEAAKRGGSKEQLEVLRELAGTVQQIAIEGDLISYLHADRRFHIALIDIVDNKPLSELVTTLRDRVRLYGFTDSRTNEHMVRSAAEHFELLALVAEGNSDGAAALMRRHLERSRDVWAANIQRSPPKPSMPDDGWSFPKSSADTGRETT